MTNTDKNEQLLLKWHHRFHKSEKSHYRSATSCRVFNYSLGIPLVIITTLVASDVFELIRGHAANQYPWGLGVMGSEALVVASLSILAPVLAALQTFLRFPERAVQHRGAAVKFGLLKKEIEKCLTFPAKSPEELRQVIDRIQEQDAQILGESPSVGTLSLWHIGRDIQPLSAQEVKQAKSAQV